MESLIYATEMIQKDENSTISNTSLIVGENYPDERNCNEAELHFRDKNDSELSSEDPSSSGSDDQDLDVDSNGIKYYVSAGNSPLSVVIKRCNSGAQQNEDYYSDNSDKVCKSLVTSTFENPAMGNSAQPHQSCQFDGHTKDSKSDCDSLNKPLLTIPCTVKEYVDTIKSLVQMGLSVDSENYVDGSNQFSIDGSKSLVEILIGSKPKNVEETGGDQRDVVHHIENTNCVNSSSLPLKEEKELELNDNLEKSDCDLTVQVDSLGRLPSDGPIEELITSTSTLVNGEHGSPVKVNEDSCYISDKPLQSMVTLQLETSHSFFEKNNISLQGDKIIYSPLLFSEDDEDDSENSVHYCPPFDNISCCDNERGSRTTEERRLKQLRVSMIGVPPPASVTNPQFSIDDLLRSLKENETWMSWPIATTEKQDMQRKFEDQRAKECAWPDSASFCYPDIYYNNSLESEQFAALSQKFAQRYVGAETACLCNMTGLTGSAATRNKKMGAGFSPGRRLSHLARRRKAFSRDNLLSNSTGGLPKSQPNALAERRQILVSTKTKLDPSRPGNSKASVNRITQSTGSRVLTHKRALFQSPDEGKKNSSAKKPQSGSKRKNNLLRAGVQSFKRALFPSASKEKEVPDMKRSRSEAHLFASTSKRKLLFGNAEVSGGTPSPLVTSNSKENLMGKINPPGSSSTIKSNTKSVLLNSAHKKKLLWAVAESLRKKGINMSHMLFRPCASSLARICRSLLPDLRRHTGSTSEMMLEIADQHASDIIREKQAEAEMP